MKKSCLAFFVAPLFLLLNGCATYTVQLEKVVLNRTAPCSGPAILTVNGKTKEMQLAVSGPEPRVERALGDLKIVIDKTDKSETLEISCVMKLSKPGLPAHDIQLFSVVLNKSDIKGTVELPSKEWSFPFEGMPETTYGAANGHVIKKYFNR